MLSVPNVALSAAGQLPPLAAAANILLPAGIYLLLMSWSGNIGRNIVLSLPLTVIAAFQIVLLYLYADGSVIAVDMFLNVATTNSSEAMELLGNLANAVLIVMIMYLPVLTAGIIFWTRGIRTSHRQRHFARITGLGAAVAGAAAMAISYSHIPHYKAEYDIFPVNALFNLQEAVHRKIRTDNYAATSSEYTFNVSNTPPDKTREIYVAVVGETSRADNYQIFGYDRFTTPLLNTVDSLVAYEKVLSESNTTHKSVPMLLSTIEADEYNDSIYVSKSIITAFKEAGFHTAFLSMQSRNRSFIDFFGEEADTTIFVREQHSTANGQNITDLDILPYLDSLLVSIPDQKEDAQLRDLAVMVLLYETGAMVQELIDLCPRNIRFSSTVVAELHGNGNKTRPVPVNADAAAIVRSYIRRYSRTDADEPLFVNRNGEKLTRAGIQYIIDKYVSTARARHPDLFRDRITNHSFSHSKAMHLLEAGVNLVYIRDLLGHTSVVTTEIYAKTNPKVKEEQFKKHSASVATAKKYNKKEKEDLIDWLKKDLLTGKILMQHFGVKRTIIM